METLKHWSIGSVVRRNAPPAFNTSLALIGNSSQNAPTVVQVTLFLLWQTTIILWLFRLFCSRRRSALPVTDDSDPEATMPDTEHEPLVKDDETERRNGKTQPRKNAQTVGTQKSVNTGTEIVILGNEDDAENEITTQRFDTEMMKIPNGNANTNRVFHDAESPHAATKEESPEKNNGQKNENKGTTSTFSKVKPPPTFDEFLKYCSVFGLIMMYFFLCDYRHEWPEGPREYSRDLFMFLTLLLFTVAGVFTVQTTPDKILNRDQTEEWKGWMQVMFVWYHYYKAKETYNYIRIFIACYVWMTGFGNFSFFWVRKDFSLFRVLKMLFRLNFLVIMTLMVTNNSYMLYYICAMHTYWFLSVYAFMGILPSWNENRPKMAAKFVCYFLINALLFDTPVRDVVFKPFWFVLSYKGSMHEWLFRAGLDHYAALLGMLCAYNYPHYERFMNYLDKRHLNRHDYLTTVCIKMFICGLLCAVLAIWYDNLMWHGPYDYNNYHPYTSWVPILIYIFFRNLFPALRTRFLGLFAFLGKITLETYIAQLHIYMQFGAQKRIIFVPNYPLMNFALASVIFLVVSHQLFQLTMDLSAFILPKDMKKVLMNGVIGSVIIALHVCFALLCREIGIV